VATTLPRGKVPYPHEVLGTILQNPTTFIDATWQTTSRAVVGFFIGLGLGLLVGAAMAQSRWVENAIVPYVLASQMIPLVALVPILHAVLKDADLVRLYVTAVRQLLRLDHRGRAGPEERLAQCG